MCRTEHESVSETSCCFWHRVHLTQGNWAVTPPISTSGTEGIVRFCKFVISGDGVDWQSTGRPVQVHSYSVGEWGVDTYRSFLSWLCQEMYQSSKQHRLQDLSLSPGPEVIKQSSPADSWICYSYNSFSPSLLCLPVTAASQTRST